MRSARDATRPVRPRTRRAPRARRRPTAPTTRCPRLPGRGDRAALGAARRRRGGDARRRPRGRERPRRAGKTDARSLPFDDGDDPVAAEKAYAAAAFAAKVDAIVAASTGRTVDALGARARKTKMARRCSSSGAPAPRPSLDLEDPVLSSGPGPWTRRSDSRTCSWPPARDALPGARRRGHAPRARPRGRARAQPRVRPHGRPRSCASRPGRPWPRPTSRALAGRESADPPRGRSASPTSSTRRRRLRRLGWDVPLLGGDGHALDGGAERSATSQAPGRVHWLVGTPQLTLDGRAAPPLRRARPRRRRASRLDPCRARSTRTRRSTCCSPRRSTRRPTDPKGPKPPKDVAGARGAARPSLRRGGGRGRRSSTSGGARRSSGGVRGASVRRAPSPSSRRSCPRRASARCSGCAAPRPTGPSPARRSCG